MAHTKQSAIDLAMPGLLDPLRMTSPQHTGAFYLVFGKQMCGKSGYLQDLIAVASSDRVVFFGLCPSPQYFGDIVLVMPFHLNILFIRNSSKFQSSESASSSSSASSFFCLSVTTSPIKSTPTICNGDVVSGLVMDIVDMCSFTHYSEGTMDTAITAVDTLSVTINWLWQNRHDRNISLQKVHSLKSYIITHVNHSLATCDIHLFSTILKLALYRSQDLHYIAASLDIFVQMMFFEHQLQSHSRGKIRNLVQLALFQEYHWVEFNTWLSSAIEVGNITAIKAVAKFYILLSYSREIRLQKLPPAVLEFLKNRTVFVLEGLVKYEHIKEITRLFVHHLYAMIGLHSEPRWMFREKNGIPIILSVMNRYPGDKTIITFCCQILNFVVEGILKRKHRTFQKRELVYQAVVRAMSDFIHCFDLVSSVCKFIRKVLEICPEHVEYMSNANCIEALERVKDWYENDGEMHSVSQQALVTFINAKNASTSNKERRTSRKKSKECRSRSLSRKGSTVKQQK